MLSRFSHVRLFVILWILAHQASLSIGASRQESWSGLPHPPPGNLPNPGIELTSLTSPSLAGGFFSTSVTWEAQGTGEEAFRERNSHVGCNVADRFQGWGPARPGDSSVLTADFLGNASTDMATPGQEGRALLRQKPTVSVTSRQEVGAAGGVKRQIWFLVGTPRFLAEGWGQMVAEHMS